MYGSKGSYWYNEDDPTSCGFNPEKDPKAIARDIIRKTITPGLPLVAIINEKLAKRTKEKIARETGIKKLGDLINEKPFGENRMIE